MKTQKKELNKRTYSKTILLYIVLFSIVIPNIYSQNDTLYFDTKYQKGDVIDSDINDTLIIDKPYTVFYILKETGEKVNGIVIINNKKNISYREVKNGIAIGIEKDFQKKNGKLIITNLIIHNKDSLGEYDLSIAISKTNKIRYFYKDYGYYYRSVTFKKKYCKYIEYNFLKNSKRIQCKIEINNQKVNDVIKKAIEMKLIVKKEDGYYLIQKGY